MDWQTMQEVEIRIMFAKARVPGGMQGRIVERSLRWKPMTKEELILKADGSFRENSRKAGGGAVLRTRDGEWIAGCRQKFNAHNPREAELMAIEMGLEWARNKGINRLEIQCDNADVVREIRNGTGREKTGYRILENCRRMIGKS
nr:putative pentatricopeptide repeat-containing protein At1g12700, mitochondrial [Ipomoea trifida]